MHLRPTLQAYIQTYQICRLRSAPFDTFLIHQFCLAEVTLEFKVCSICFVKQRMVPPYVMVLQEQENTAWVWKAVSLHSKAQHNNDEKSVAPFSSCLHALIHVRAAARMQDTVSRCSACADLLWLRAGALRSSSQHNSAKYTAKQRLLQPIACCRVLCWHVGDRSCPCLHLQYPATAILTYCTHSRSSRTSSLYRFKLLRALVAASRT